jgi:2-polyprenyl-3-methyl-5-hydroxy-6-metoxy-1,4-benzoquinol methylase
MNLFVNTSHRNNRTELMDDFSLNGSILHDTLDKLGSINKWLGGNKVTIQGLEKLLKDQPKDKSLTIIDLGCGGGDMLRLVADFGIREGYVIKLIGLDANEQTVNYARSLSQKYPNISYLHMDIFSEEFAKMKYDIVLSTLFLHHFEQEKLIDFLSMILNKASVGVVVNDLHRHPLAYYLFSLLCITIPNKMVKTDGLISILKGFKRIELEYISAKIDAVAHIKWKCAFRYQWIIKRIK